MAKKAAKKAKRKAKTMMEKRVGTTAGATQRSWMVCQSTDAPASLNALVRLDADLNMINRRLYRQHKVYTTKVELASPNQDSGPIGVYVLRNSWAVRKAISLAKDIYDEAVSEERAVVGNARWHDFRIDPNGCWGSLAYTQPFTVSGYNNNGEYIPIGFLGDGEYAISQVATPQTDPNNGDFVTVEKSFTLRETSDYFRYSIFDEFQKMGPNTSSTPSAPSTGGYDRATGTTFQDENVQDLLDKGNQPPYNPNDLQLQGAWVKVGELGRQATGGMVTSTGYFEAPLGLIVLNGYTTKGDASLPIALNTRDPLVEVTVKEGDYKGVMAYDI